MTAVQTSTLDLIDLIRQSVLEEAARRSYSLINSASTERNNSAAASTSTEPAPAAQITPTTTSKDQGSAQPSGSSSAGQGGKHAPGIDVKDLVELYHDQRASNDTLQASLYRRLDRMVQQQPEAPRDDEGDAVTSQRKAKQMELARLDWDIERLQNASTHALTPLAAPLSTLTTRAVLSDLVSQYTALVPSLSASLSSEQILLDSDSLLLSDLRTVSTGLQRRHDQVAARLASEREHDSDEVLYRLRKKTEAQQKQIRDLLQALIAIAGGLFKEKARSKDFRALLEELMNRSWEHPQDPYIQVAGPPSTSSAPGSASSYGTVAGRRYDAALVELAVRGQFAVQHPRDARRIRLVAFGKPTRARV